MKTDHVAIQKSARISLLGEPSAKTEKLWLVLHGYGQLAPYFIRKFQSIDDGKTVVVAPEGLHRFYLKGYSGRVGATWMTKEDRLTDISDNHAYLNQIWNYFTALCPNARLGLIGFSQGAATAVRWFCQTPSPPQKLIIWSGAFPEDLNWFEDIPTLNRVQPTFVLGDNDEFYDESRIAEHTAWMISTGLDFNVIRFTGGHDIHADTLLDIQHSL